MCEQNHEFNEQVKMNGDLAQENAELRDTLEVLLSLETLEYHDKNWLNRSLDNKRMNEEKRRLIKRTLK